MPDLPHHVASAIGRTVALDRIRELESEVARLKAKADAYDLWRAEALAAHNWMTSAGHSTEAMEYQAALKARVDAGLE